MKAQSRMEIDVMSAGSSFSWGTCPFPRNGSSCLARPQAWPAAVAPRKLLMFLKSKSNNFRFLSMYLYQTRLPAFQLSSLNSLLIYRLYKKQDACCLWMLIPTRNLSQPRTPCLLCLIQSVGGFFRQRNRNFSLGVWTEISPERGKATQCMHIQYADRFVMGEAVGWRGL